MTAQKYPQEPVLIIDDEKDVLQSYRMALGFNGINNIVLCSDSREVMRNLSQTACSAIILDLSMPHISGMELLSPIRENFPEIPAIVVTASNDLATAVACMKQGAFDYMVKPVEDSRLVSGLKNAIELHELRCENSALSRNVLTRQVTNPMAFSSIITVSASMTAIFSYVETIASSCKPVLITGESGTGKELFARAIHTVSGRQGKFVAVNVGGLDDTVFSDTLFGHRKGAFTGADTDRKGLIEEAAGGTLFLDEIGPIGKNTQVKLLRLLQENEYYSLGSDVCKSSSVAVIAATNDDLLARTKQGAFRNDLYFRLLTHHIHVPPLRERREDLPVLVNHFLTQACAALSRERPAVPEGLLRILNRYDFPGNVRELQSLVFDAAGRCTSPALELDCFKKYIARQTGRGPDDTAMEESNNYAVPYHGGFPRLKEVEDFLVDEAMKKAGGSQSVAAQLLGVAQSTLSRRFKKED
jgi:DNA-binding NtrC family response regulator